MLYPRGSLAVTALGDSLYAIGGFDSKEALNVVEVMDTRTMKWRSLQPLSAERAYGEATVVDDQVTASPMMHTAAFNSSSCCFESKGHEILHIACCLLAAD